MTIYIMIYRRKLVNKNIVNNNILDVKWLKAQLHKRYIQSGYKLKAIK